MIAPGTVVASRYRVIQPLGQGGMKTVYLAEDLRFQARQCALAVMVDIFTTEQTRRDAVIGFEREADVLAQLDHPAIPKVSDRFSEQDHHYFVMDYVAGQTLEAKLAVAGGRLGQAEAIDLVVQICDALDYLHHRNPPVVYRDLKPANIIVTPNGRIKLVDFGIARHFTRNGTTIGTIGFAAPEQYQGQCEPRSDIYALAATLYYLVSGRDPARFPLDFPPLSTLLPDCDSNLDQLVGEALKRDPGQRPANAREFARRLLAIGVTPSEAVARTQERHKPGMHFCSKCGVEISADATQCPNCGAAGVTQSGILANQPLSASAATIRLCKQCRREIPMGADVCPGCSPSAKSEPKQSQHWLVGVNHAVPFVPSLTLIAVAAGLLAHALWGSGAEMPWPIWISVGLLLMAIEVHYTRDFTLFCFAASALLVGLMTILGILDFWTQWAIFAALSAALLFSAREWLRKKMLSRTTDAELENIVGQSAIPLDDLPAYGFGKAELRGSTWSAHNASHVKIMRGQRCKVMRINGLTLWIMPE